MHSLGVPSLILAAIAIGSGWILARSPGPMRRFLIPVGGLCGLFALVFRAMAWQLLPLASPAVAAAAIVWLASLLPRAWVQDDCLNRLTGYGWILSMGLLYGLPLFWSTGNPIASGAAFGGDILVLGATGLLVSLVIAQRCNAEGLSLRPASILSGAWLLYTAAIIAYGVAAQSGSGVYWNWAPVASWRLAGWALLGTMTVAARQGHASARRMCWIPLISALIGLGASLLIIPVVQWLDLTSMYL